MRTLFLIRRVVCGRRWLGLMMTLLLLGAGGAAGQSAPSYLAVTVEISGSLDQPQIRVYNNSRGAQITNFFMTIGDVTKTFDAAFGFTEPPGGSITRHTPDGNASGGVLFPAVSLTLGGFDPGESFTMRVDIDTPGDAGTVQDYRTVFFNNGSQPNAQVVVQGAGLSATLTLADTTAGLSQYTFRLPRPLRTLNLESVTEAGGLAVRVVTVQTNEMMWTNTVLTMPTNHLIGARTRITVSDGDTIEIRAPQAVYMNIFGSNITDSVEGDPAAIADAEERFTAIGISVDNVVQTGDPTLYRFDITKDTDVTVKWRHEFALTIDHDFALTASQDLDETGKPWAGPLESKAVGNPVPEARKHWIKSGDPMIATIDGQVLDFSRPGLDIRYVPVAYRAYGPPNKRSSQVIDQSLRLGSPGVDIRTNSQSVTVEPFDSTDPFGAPQHPPQRYQVPAASTPGQSTSSFVMYGPAGITYVWRIQFGVRVNMDDPGRVALPKVDRLTGSSFVEVGDLEGTYWFNPGTTVRVGSTANDPAPGNKALNGWINGDGHYFSSSGEIDSTDGSLVQGGPGQRADGSPAANWETEFFDSQSRPHRGLVIPDLQRAARVFWRYGDQQLKTLARIGEYVFQNEPANAALFTAQPDQITRVLVSGANTNASDMTVWDPVAAKLYPVVPGIFKARWRPDPASTNTLEVIVTAIYPEPSHYPHIVNTPGVALDPDPNDNFIFKELKYSENDAVVDGSNRFFADRSGRSVLLFSQIQRIGRGQPQEFLQVRVVESQRWNDRLPPDGVAVIGRKITDPQLDRANLETGYIMFSGARYNPFVYDATRLEGLAARDVYDLELLGSDAGLKVVAQQGNLPGPIIPVNLHPGASSTQRVVVVWYDDPLENDWLLWPHRARVYGPRWPTNATEGLGRIVIASEFGNESVGTNGLDQVVAGAVTNVLADASGNPVTNVISAALTYDPSRLQQVQIYSQPDPVQPGYNPNEEHGLLAPSWRSRTVSPRPPAVYALRENDLNRFNRANVRFDERLENPATFTSHPFVLVQFFDTAVAEMRMRVYAVQKEDPAIPEYHFADPARLVSSTAPRQLLAEPHLTMEAGEPVIPFYPLVEVIGAAPCAQSFGTDLKAQSVYWEDHKGSSWAVSGGENAWFTASFHYPLAPDFWWPPNRPGFIREQVSGSISLRLATVPQTGECVSFLPARIDSLLAFAPEATVPNSPGINADLAPTRILYKSDWPVLAPVLKAGETLTFQGGEFRADHQFIQIVEEGELKTVETPGLPGIVAFASAEVVFDSLNPEAVSAQWKSRWTARVAQVLDVRSVPMSLGQFPPDLAPATGRTRVSGGKYIFNELPASLQKRVRFDPLSGKLEMIGLLNDKDIGADTLTAAPPAVYVLEPNIITADDLDALLGLSDNANWVSAVAQLAKLTQNPSLIDSDANLPNPSASDYRSKLESFWRSYYQGVGALQPGAVVPLPVPITSADGGYLVGLEPVVLRDSTDAVVTIEDPVVTGLRRVVRDPKIPAPMRAFGPGLALVPNADFLDPVAGYPEISWVVVAENNDSSLGGSPITLHVVKVDRRERYRGAIKTVTSDNVFDENLVLRHQGDFGANADALYFEWWYRPDDGSLNVPPPDLLKPGQTNPWKLFADPSGNRGRGWFTITLKGNPNAPEALLADTWWFVRYRHANDVTQGTDWAVDQPDGTEAVNFTWAGAGNSDPFNDFDADGLPDFRAQLAQGWIKRVLDAVNPYEARIRDFEGDNPATYASMIRQFGPRYEGPVALNPAKNVIENVGLIELYETILKRGRDLSIDLSRPVSTPAIANALQLASTRISDFYTILGNEAYADAQDPTIGFGSDSVEYGSLAPAVFAFQNQMSGLIEEELALLRGVDDYFARPVYNRLFWNFTKGEGEAAYANNYNVSDVTQDGFIDEDDAMVLFPQGHGDAWGHYLTAVRNQYDLLRHVNFNWVSRSEYYNLQDIVIKVDFLDERKFVQVAATRAKTGAEIVSLTYRQKYVEDPNAQWQGYRDSAHLKDRSWGVQGWARRAAQGAYFDWVTANALLPSDHPNDRLEGIQIVDRGANSDISVISANLNAVQQTFDQANKGQNPLGISGDTIPFDLNPVQLEDLSIYGKTHFEQIYERALRALANAQSVWNEANESRNRVRQVANSELEFRNAVFQEDLSYRNQLIKIFGRPYEGTIGPGRLYPAGYDGPDTLLFMYVDVRTIDNTTVPGPAASFATFSSAGAVNGGAIYDAFNHATGDFADGSGSAPRATLSDIQYIAPELRPYLSDDTRRLFAPTFVGGSSAGILLRDQLYAVNYTDLMTPKVALTNPTPAMPVTAAGYTFLAPRDWGRRLAVGELQLQINKMLQQEAQIAVAIGAWDALQGEITRELRFINAKLDMQANIRVKNEVFSRLKVLTLSILEAIASTLEILNAVEETVTRTLDLTGDAFPDNLPTGGLSISPGDALAPVDAGFKLGSVAVEAGMNGVEAGFKIAKIVAEAGLTIAENELDLFEKRETDALDTKEMLKGLENLVGDEPIKRIEIFKEVESLRELSDGYRSMLGEGTRLIDERAAYNKRVAAQTQRNRYQDMTFRVARNHALQSYRSMFELAARYSYLTAKAYDYETNLDPGDPGSPRAVFGDIVRARGLGAYDDGEVAEPGVPRMQNGGLAAALAWMKINYDAMKTQLGINNPELETGKISLRTELFRILPKAEAAEGGGDPEPVVQPVVDGFPSPGELSDNAWRQVLSEAWVQDLWMIPEFRYYCRPFAAESDVNGAHVAEPGLVLRFSTRVMAGQNFFGRPLSGGDHAYDPSHYATKIRSVGVWFSEYLSGDVLNDLPAAPRVYLVPMGLDVMSIPTSEDPNFVRLWKVVDQRIPVPLPALTADLDNGNWIPLLDSLNGRLGEPRKFSMFRAYHDGGSLVNTDELVADSRLVGRSIWNTQWLLIIPGRVLNSDPAVGLERFIQQVSDIKLVFQTYGYSGG